MSSSIDRRRALGLLMVGSASVAAGVTGWVAGLGRSGSGLDRVAGGDAMAEPAVLASHDGELDVSLTAAPGAALAGTTGSVLGLNGASPGPTLQVRPGDVLRVHLANRLQQPTNLHTHGLRVSPKGNGDNPFVSIAPGESFDYRFMIPHDHPPGTFWYHPHRHGYVADQLFGGLAGALVVAGGPDLDVGADRVMLLTDISLNNIGRVSAVGPMDRMMGRQGRLILVNGQYQPVITAAPGVTERWRLINACTSRVLSLRLDGHPLTQIAADGHFLPAPVTRKQVVLAPGNRTDVVIRPLAHGRFTLWTDPYDRGSPGMMGMMGGAASTAARAPVVLATVAVSGTNGSAPPLPATLPAPALPSGLVSVRRRVSFEMQMGMAAGGMRWTIDRRAYDAERTDQAVQLGATEEWLVTNNSSMDHPFHLHVWPFQVLATSAAPAAEQSLRDVVLVPARGWARLRVHFADFAGRSVYHCHILDHEDTGMMATIEVAP
ncbi:MAG: multicopper oxidase family protein [Actinomycetia bacterium]|nr:multicopper oxidase family protein [Actinomycetes bacterium]